jgi:outer membrane protein assembly factor BamB
VVWNVAIPGLGWSSPIVWGRYVFVTSAEEEGQTEAPKKGLYLQGERALVQRTCRRMVMCMEFETGKVIWSKVACAGVPAGPRHLKNSYASETPVTDGERVYAYFGNAGLYAYDLQGNLAWSRSWDPVDVKAGWGTAASPALHGDRLYIVNDNQTKSWLAALDKRTGEPVWRVDRDEKSNWATPYVWVNAQRTEIVTPGSGKTRSYGLDGKLLWELTGASAITIPTPFASAEFLYVASGFIMSARQPLWAIRPGASGDISLPAGQTENESIAWCQPAAAPYNPSPLLYRDLLYVLLDRGALSCYDARTGEAKYERQDLPGYGAYTASPWAYNGRVFCLSEDGDTQVIQAGPEFKVLGTNKLGEMCMACPASVSGSLILRTQSSLYRLQQLAVP